VGWTFVWMMVVLKIPVALALWLVWYAVREPDLEEDVEPRGDGGSGGDHPRPRHPGPPRRGPHAEPLPPSPARVRVAAGKQLSRQH
jgi:hypothetical protein